ncbi:TOBE domain-containing protein [Mesocricetibacter intestinalis]|nr:TOBE domain-containing protein [Mesocricetibacter intestinalis]
MLQTEILLTIKLHRTLFVDPKRILLLKEINRCGSINRAAKNAKVSYKSAWDNLEAMNKISPKPLLERNAGGTVLTAYAQRLLQLYDLLELTQEKAFRVLQDENIALNNALSATARFSLQSSARNQFFGKVSRLPEEGGRCPVEILIDGLTEPMRVLITQKSAQRLQLACGKEVMLMFKAPWVKIHQHMPHNAHNRFQAVVSAVSDMEEGREIMLQPAENLTFCALAGKAEEIKCGETYWLSIDPAQIILATL